MGTYVAPGSAIDPTKHYVLIKFDGPSIVTVRGESREFMPEPLNQKKDIPGTSAYLVTGNVDVENPNAPLGPDTGRFMMNIYFGEYVLIELPPDTYTFGTFIAALNKAGNLVFKMELSEPLQFTIAPESTVTYYRGPEHQNRGNK